MRHVMVAGGGDDPGAPVRHLPALGGAAADVEVQAEETNACAEDYPEKRSIAAESRGTAMLQPLAGEVHARDVLLHGGLRRNALQWHGASADGATH